MLKLLTYVKKIEYLLKFNNTHSVNINVIVLNGVCIIMYEELKNEDIIVELKTLIDKAEEVQSDIDAYCEFMKQTFLATSGLN